MALPEENEESSESGSDVFFLSYFSGDGELDSLVTKGEAVGSAAAVAVRPHAQVVVCNNSQEQRDVHKRNSNVEIRYLCMRALRQN